jgi:hypothetical protein
MPAISDSFDIDPPCAWGILDTDGTTTVTAEGGRLVIRPTPNNAQTRGGCLGPTMPFTADAGVFMHVTETRAGDEFKHFAVDWQGSTWLSFVTWGVADITYYRGLDINDPQKIMLGMVDFSPATTSWVRMRPSDDGMAVLAEVSSDGRSWFLLGTDAITPPTHVSAIFQAGTFTGDATPRAIYFDDFDVCPP